MPLGVVFFIYESRPNVTADAAAICVKSGNAVILRGGKEAAHSSRGPLSNLLDGGARRSRAAGRRRATGRHDRSRGRRPFPAPARVHRPGDSPRRRRSDPPRGRRSARCRSSSISPAIATSTSIARPISTWPSRSRSTPSASGLGVCNAAESLLVHADVAAEFLPRIGAVADRARHRNSRRRRARSICCRPPSRRAKPITRPNILGRSFRSRVVDSLDEAIEHINHYGSHHTDAIVTARSGGGARVHGPGRQLGGDGQRQHAIQRRRRIRPGSRNRHQHRQIPRPRPLRLEGTDQLQVRRVRRRASSRMNSHGGTAEIPAASTREGRVGWN